MARNMYAGYCYSCGAYVQPGYGHFERRKGLPKWRIKCVKCASGRTITADDLCVKAIERKRAKLGGNKCGGLFDCEKHESFEPNYLLANGVTVQNFRCEDDMKGRTKWDTTLK